MMKQVYQKLVFPTSLSKDEYEFPYSGTNLEGTLDRAYALFSLVDPQSVFDRVYSPTALSFSMSYKRIINCIDVINDNAIQIVSKAKEKLRDEKEITLGAFTRPFFLVETNPYNWYKTNAQEISFSVGPPDCDADYVEIGSLSKRVVNFNGFAATILRPWFDNRVFGNTNWIIRGYEKGEISSGTYVDNDGAIPLIPIQLLIAVNNGRYMLEGVISDLVPLTPAKSTKDLDRARVFQTLSKDKIDMRVRSTSVKQESSLLSTPVKEEKPLLFVDKFGKPIKGVQSK